MIVLVLSMVGLVITRVDFDRCCYPLDVDASSLFVSVRGFF